MPDEMIKTTKQMAAEADVESFRQALGPFVVAAEATRMPMIFTDAQATGHPIIFVNQAFLKLTGYQEHEVLGHAFDFLMAQGTDPEMLAEIRTAFDGGRDLTPLARFRCQDGGAVWVAVCITAVHDERGDVVQHFASFVDVTRHKDEEDRLRSLLDQLNERTQATLSTILAIREATFGGLTDDDLVALQGSILALSKTQDILEDAGDHVALGDLVRQILQRAGADGKATPRIHVDGADVRVPARQSVVLAMLVQELASNAMTHGSLSNDGGDIDVSWRIVEVEDAQRLRLRWQENGGAAGASSRPGYVTRLIERGLAYELGAVVTFHRQAKGLICEISLPWAGLETP